MTNSVTILPSHKGFTVPRVMDSEYCVDAVCDITAYTANGEVVNASQFGLSTINCAVVAGLEKPATYAVVAETGTTGKYASGKSFQLAATNLDGTNAASSANADIGAVRLRVWGQI